MFEMNFVKVTNMEDGMFYHINMDKIAWVKELAEGLFIMLDDGTHIVTTENMADFINKTRFD